MSSVHTGTHTHTSLLGAKLRDRVFPDSFVCTNMVEIIDTLVGKELNGLIQSY